MTGGVMPKQQGRFSRPELVAFVREVIGDVNALRGADQHPSIEVREGVRSIQVEFQIDGRIYAGRFLVPIPESVWEAFAESQRGGRGYGRLVAGITASYDEPGPVMVPKPEADDAATG